MKLYIFADVDGTIYNHQTKKLLKETKQSIKEFQKKGNEFIICTGNPYIDNMPELAKKLKVNYSINSNGGSIYDLREDKFILKSVLLKDDAQQILDFAQKNQFGCDWWDSEKIYCNMYLSEDNKKYLKNSISKNGDIIVSEVIHDDIFKIEFYDDPEKIDIVVEYFQNKGFQLARTRPELVEITQKNVSKGNAIKEFLKQNNIDENNIMVIGDSANDIPMLSIFENSYAMGNSPQHVKDFANHMTGHVDDNGIGDAIDDFVERIGAINE